MSTPIDLVRKLLEGIRTKSIEDLRAKNISQGDLGMITEVSDSKDGPTGGLLAEPHWYYTVYGRRPGKQPPIESILGWLKKKGIEPGDMSERSLAFIFARKIGQLGTDIYLGKRPGLSLPAIIEMQNQGFEEDIKKHYDQQVDATIMAGLDAIFKPSN